MKLSLQDIKNLARNVQEKLHDNFSCKNLINSCENIILQFFLAKILQEKLHFSARLARYVQDLMQDLAKKYLQNLHISCKMVFTGLYFSI